MTDVAGGLITLEYALTGLGYNAPSGTTTARDADITAYIQAATPVIEGPLCVGGPVLQTVKTITRRGGKSGVLLNGRIANAAAVTAVRVDGSAATGFIVDVDAGIIYAGSGITFAGDRVEVDLTVGYNPIPQGLQLATRELVRHWVQIGKQSPAGGVLNQQPDTAGDPNDPFAVPRRVRQLCAPFRGGGFA